MASKKKAKKTASTKKKSARAKAKPSKARATAAKAKAKKPSAAAKRTSKPKAKAKTKAKAKPAKKPTARRDATGHLDPKYAATLREKGREGRVRDRDTAFIGRSGRAKDVLAEGMGEAFVETATSGEDENEEVFNQDVAEDEGGPFVPSTAGQEFASGTDASNPKRAKRAPFPTT